MGLGGRRGRQLIWGLAGHQNLDFTVTGWGATKRDLSKGGLVSAPNMLAAGSSYGRRTRSLTCCVRGYIPGAL